MILSTLFSSITWCQDKNALSIGSNLPPLLGNTYTLFSEIIPNKKYTLNLELGGMFNNDLQGSFTKEGTGRSDHINSGYYISTGIRFTPRQKINQSYFFIGTKLLGGYFEQSAVPWEDFESFFADRTIPEDYYFKDNRVYSEGYYFGFAAEIGYNIRILKKIHIELGLQGGRHFFTTKRQVDQIFSILPGLGALNVVGILRPKIVF